MGPTLNRIKRLQADVKSLRSCRRGADLANLAARSAISRAEIHQRLEQCSLEMFTGRPFILVNHRIRANENPHDPAKRTSRPFHTNTNNGPQDFGADPVVPWETLVQDCISAAKEVIQLLHIMRTTGLGLARSSYVEYSSCRASLLVLIAYSTCYRTNELASTLQIGLNAIKEMASSGDSARSEISLLETLESALQHLRAFDPGPAEVNDTPVLGGYAGFVNWYKERKTTSVSHIDPLLGSGPELSAEQVQASQPQDTQATNTERDTAYIGSNMMFDDSISGFDLFNTDASGAFFTPDFATHGFPEKDLYESLLRLPI